MTDYPKFQDDRSPDQATTHTVYVAMTDSCMSGWGPAAGRKSIAAWACTPDQMGNVERWVRNRSDARYVRVTSMNALKRAAARGDLVHVYVADETHPAHS